METRSSKSNSNLKPLKVSDIGYGLVSKDQLENAQQIDGTLGQVRDRLSTGQRDNRGGKVIWFVLIAGLIYKCFMCPHIENGKLFKQLVVPKEFREQILRLAHESMFGAHLGIKKTCDRVLSKFYWPDIHGDVNRFCKSCDICQRTFPKGKVTCL